MQCHVLKNVAARAAVLCDYRDSPCPVWLLSEATQLLATFNHRDRHCPQKSFVLLRILLHLAARILGVALDPKPGIIAAVVPLRHLPLSLEWLSPLLRGTPALLRKPMSQLAMAC